MWQSLRQKRSEASGRCTHCSPAWWALSEWSAADWWMEWTLSSAPLSWFEASAGTCSTAPCQAHSPPLALHSDMRSFTAFHLFIFHVYLRRKLHIFCLNKFTLWIPRKWLWLPSHGGSSAVKNRYSNKFCNLRNSLRKHFIGWHEINLWCASDVLVYVAYIDNWRQNSGGDTKPFIQHKFLCKFIRHSRGF